jgi:hypothetical protein
MYGIRDFATTGQVFSHIRTVLDIIKPRDEVQAQVPDTE